MAIYTVFWLIGILVLYFGTTYALKLYWVSVGLLALFGTYLVYFNSKVAMFIYLRYLRVQERLAPLCWAWLPSLILGLFAVSIPIHYAMVTVNGLGGVALVPSKDMVIYAVLSLIPLLSLFAIIRTPTKFARLSRIINISLPLDYNYWK